MASRRRFRIERDFVASLLRRPSHKGISFPNGRPHRAYYRQTETACIDIDAARMIFILKRPDAGIHVRAAVVVTELTVIDDFAAADFGPREIHNCRISAVPALGIIRRGGGINVRNENACEPIVSTLSGKRTIKKGE